MKKVIALSAITVSLAFGARAQWEVYDPAVHIQLIMDEAKDIAKYIQMINNQVQQINTLTAQLTQFKHYEDLFGDPKAVALSMAPALESDLLKTEPGRTLENLLTTADGAYALAYNELGIFQTIGSTFTTPSGQTVTRTANDYKPFAAVSRTADNFASVANDAAARRAAIKAQIAQTTEQLKNAATDAQVQKLHAVLTGLNADLASTDDELNQAADSALVQDIQNRNDRRKQQQALTDERNAQFNEAVGKYVTTFPLLTEPTQFPTQ